MSLKSAMFFSLFCLVNSSSKANTKSLMMFSLLCISNKSSMACSELPFSTSTALLNCFFTTSLFCFANSFTSSVIFLSVGHFSNCMLPATSTIAFHVSCAIAVSIWPMSAPNTSVYFFSSSYPAVCLYTSCNFILQSKSWSLISCMIILPHFVVAKSWSVFSISNSFTFSASHSLGNGLLCIKV